VEYDECLIGGRGKYLVCEELILMMDGSNSGIFQTIDRQLLLHSMPSIKSKSHENQFKSSTKSKENYLKKISTY
jgi:hypothetical protein